MAAYRPSQKKRTKEFDQSDLFLQTFPWQRLACYLIPRSRNQFPLNSQLSAALNGGRVTFCLSEFVMRATRLRIIVLLTLIFSLSATEVGLAKPRKKRRDSQRIPFYGANLRTLVRGICTLDQVVNTMRPDLRRITFLKEEKGGLLKEVSRAGRIRKTWVVKVGKEAQSETSAVRCFGAWLFD
jgi:hypothetical protein